MSCIVAEKRIWVTITFTTHFEHRGCVRQSEWWMEVEILKVDCISRVMLSIEVERDNGRGNYKMEVL